MRGTKRTLKQAKEEMMEFIDKDTILLGHALENDLQALQLIHKRVIDTSILFSSKTGRRPSLKEVSFAYAKLNIQMVQSNDSEIA